MGTVVPLFAPRVWHNCWLFQTLYPSRSVSFCSEYATDCFVKLKIAPHPRYSGNVVPPRGAAANQINFKPVCTLWRHFWRSMCARRLSWSGDCMREQWRDGQFSQLPAARIAWANAFPRSGFVSLRKTSAAPLPSYLNTPCRPILNLHFLLPSSVNAWLPTTCPTQRATQDGGRGWVGVEKSSWGGDWEMEHFLSLFVYQCHGPINTMLGFICYR